MTALLRTYGLTIDSDIPLHVRRPARSGSEVDVVIRRGSRVSHREHALDGERLVHHETGGTAHYTYVRTPAGSYVLRYHDLCDFVIDRGLDRVEVRPARPEAEGVAGVLAAGAVLSFILSMRGAPVLHASAVQTADGALAFVGCSGMGKSTLATVLCASGAALVTDDVLRLTLDPAGASPPLCHPGATELRLRAAASGLAGAFAGQPDQRRTGDERDALSAPEAVEDEMPLRAIVVPRPRRDITEVGAVRLAPKTAMLWLLRFPRIVGWESTDVVSAQFRHAAAVAGSVPVFLTDVPWGPPFPPDLAPRLLETIGGRCET